MSANYVALFMNLLTADISILLAAKGMQVDRSQEAFTNKLAVFIFSKYKKRLKCNICRLFAIHYLQLFR